MFSLPATAGPLGDSIWVADVRLRKFAIYDADLNHVRDAVLPPGAASPSAMVSSDTLLVTRNGLSTTEWETQIGGQQRPLLSLDLSSLVLRITLGDRVTTLLNPFGSSELAVVNAADASVVKLSTEDERLALIRLSHQGDTLRAVTLPLDAEPVPEDWYESELDRLVSSLGGSTDGGDLRQVLAGALHRPEATFALSRAAVGHDGTLWFGQRRSGGSRWHAVNLETGDYLGSVELQGREEIRSGSRDHVWLLEYDDFDVQFLTKRPLVRIP